MRKKYFILILAVIFIIAGIAGVVLTNYYYSSYSGSYSAGANYSTNGERIYFTGISEKGQISFRGGPVWLRMHGGGCASCHGEDGHGGLQIMMSDEITPGITYKSLTEEKHEEEEHPLYNDKLIKRAIVQGLNPAGEALDWSMPRWNMSDEDFEDLLKFIKELD